MMPTGKPKSKHVLQCAYCGKKIIRGRVHLNQTGYPKPVYCLDNNECQAAKNRRYRQEYKNIDPEYWSKVVRGVWPLYDGVL